MQSCGALLGLIWYVTVASDNGKSADRVCCHRTLALRQNSSKVLFVQMVPIYHCPDKAVVPELVCVVMQVW